MRSKMKRRLGIVSVVVAVVLVAVLAVAGGNTAAKSVSIADAVNGDMQGQKIQVSGNVVDDSYTSEGDVLTFAIYDPNTSSSEQLVVRYVGSASSTFGNDVTAICTGKIDSDGILQATELITKCPSKYEGADASQHPADVTEDGE